MKELKIDVLGMEYSNILAHLTIYSYDTLLLI